MAGKNKFESGNDFDFDHSLDIPDFSSFGDFDTKRSARQVATGLSKAALKGALGSQGLLESEFIRRTIRTVLPKGYGSALDIADEATSTLRSLYDETSREMKPLLNDMKRTVQRMEEPIDKYLPKSLATKMKNWGRSLEAGASYEDPEAQREAMLQAQLAEVMRFNVTSEAKRQQREDSRSKIREGIEQVRHKDSMGQLNQIRLSVAQLAAYQNNITSGYHRKSLELQFRSYYALRDMLVEQRRMNEVTTEAFQKIIKNTGLPDYVKLKESDRLKQAMRNRFGDAAMSFGQGIIGERANFIRQTGENLRKVLSQRIKDFAWGAQQGLQGVNEGAELMSMMGGMQLDGLRPEEILLGGASGMAAQHYGTKAMQALIKRLPKTGRMAELLQKGTAFGNRLQYGVTNLPGKAKNWAQSYDDLPGYLKFLPRPMQDLLRDAILMNGGLDRTIQKDRLKDMQGPAIFSRQVAKSITEVIPGYLARIFRELQVIRTGDEGIELTAYDFTSNKFSRTSEVRKRLYGTVINKSNSEQLNRDMEELLNEIDPQKKLSPGARAALRQQLMRDNLHNQSGSAEFYMDPLNHRNNHSFELARHFEDRYGKENDRSYGQRVQFANKHVALGQGVKLAREEIQDLANAGFLDQLEDLGLIDQYGNIDIEKISDYHLDNKYQPAGGASSLRRASRKRGGAAASNLRGSGIRHTTNHIVNEAPGYAAAYDRSTAGSQDFGGVIEAIKANNNLSHLDKVNETLSRIEEIMKAGLVVWNAGDLGDGSMMGPAGSGPGGPGFWDRSLRQNWMHGKQRARGLGRQAWEWWKKPGWGTAQWNKRDQHMASIKGAFGSVRDTVGGWVDQAKKKWEDMKEVYIEGELKPRLTAWGFKAGMYYDGPITDAKRKLIKSWKDIKGSVYDAEGNLILDPQQASQAFVRTTAGKKLLAVKNWVWDKAKAGFQGGLSVYGAARDALRSAVNKGMQYLDAQDVYTKDDLENPKLQAVVMRAKGYRSFHRRDKYIMTPGDIDGPVVNLTGDQVLTDNDLRTGICDKWGRPLLTGKLRLLQFGKDTMQMAFQKVQNGFNMAKDFLSGKWQGFKNWFHVDGIAFSGGKTIIERLTEIRDLLDARLPKRKRTLGDVDGDGIREGSYEDQKKKGLAGTVAKGESAADIARDAAAKFKEGGMSIYGALGAGGKALFDFLKRRKGGAADAEKKEGESALSEYGSLGLTALSLIPGGKIFRGLGRGVRGLGRLGRAGLEGVGDVLKAGGAARAAGKSGFVATAEAFKAAKGMKLAQEAEEILHAAMAAGVPQHEAEALAKDALMGGKAAEKVGLGASVRKGLLSGLKGAWSGAGKLYNLNRAGNAATWDMAKSGLGMAGRGLGAGMRLGARGLWQAGKLGVTRGLPWMARDISSNLGRVGRFAGRGALGLAKMGGGLGLGLGLDVAEHYANKTGHKTLGKYLGYAGTAATGIGLASTAASLMGISGGALGLAGAIGTGLVGLVGAPVLIGGALLGAAGYGLYKGIQYMNRKKLTDLSKLRYIQYGFSPKDEGHQDAIWKLEDMLEPLVSFRLGKPVLGTKGLKDEDLLEPFGVDKSNKEQMQKFVQWFTLRFKPVFMVHMAALHKVKEDMKSLKDAEGLKAPQKKAYLQVASWPGGPYKYMEPPFPDMDALETSDSDVTEYAKSLMAKVDDEVQKHPEENKPDPKKAPKTVAEIAAAATVAQGLGRKQPQSNWQAIKDLAGTEKDSQAGASAAGAIVTMKGNFDASHLSVGSTLDGVSTIRFKTYGLKDMNIEKVKTLLVLENNVLKDVDINAKYVATYKGDIQKTFAAQAPAFGVNGPASTEAYNWISWFKMRFLPTYLNYLTAVCGAARKNDPRAAFLTLKPDQMLDVAAAVRTAHGQSGSVWSVTQMPWPQYQANTDVSSTDENFAGLQEKATKTKLDEVKGVPGAGDTESKNGGSGAAQGGVSGWFASKWKSLTTDEKGNKNWLGKASDAVGNFFGGSSYGGNNGSPISSAGPGTGGSVNSLPNPKGDGSFAALKDLIYAAAKMVGVDPQLMSVMAAIESGFRATVKGSGSSAEGLYQFITGTWNDVVKKYGPKYGIGPDAKRTDPKANALMGAEFTKANIGVLQRGLGRMPTPGEVYAAHFFGADTALKVLKENPSTIAAQILPKQAAASGNRPIFYDGARARTVGEVVAYLNNLVASRGKQLGVGVAGGEKLTSSDAGSTAGKPPAALTPEAKAAQAAVEANKVNRQGGDRFGPVPSSSTPSSTGTGAPMGYGGSSGPATSDPGAGNQPPRTVFDALGGQGKPGTPGVKVPVQSSAAPQDPFAVPAMGPAAAMGTGFTPMATRSATDLLATQRNQAVANPAALPDGGIAQQHLDVSKQILAQMQLLVKYAAQQASQISDAAAVQNKVANGQSNVPQPMKRAPISVAKPNFS